VRTRTGALTGGSLYKAQVPAPRFSRVSSGFAGAGVVERILLDDLHCHRGGGRGLMDHNYQYIVARLQEALAADARVSTLDIRITVHGGKVHLTGEVGSEERREALTAVASAVLPGTPIYNEVTVIGALGAPQLERING
jgi:hypothetical protein